MKNFNTNTDNKGEWLTPPEIIRALGPFDLDPCAPVNRLWDMAARHYTIEDDGLVQPWQGRVWLNPPYGRETFRWMAKLAVHKKGIALIFARTETKGFHREIWEKAHSVLFFEGRLSFYTVDGKQGGAANVPLCLVSYRDIDTTIIAMTKNYGQIKGKLVGLNNG